MDEHEIFDGKRGVDNSQYRIESSSDGVTAPRRAMPESPTFAEMSLGRRELRTLEWYPKPLTVGDMDGTGAQKMLGRASNVSAAEVLVRETAQNSWDACDSDTQMIFELHLRRATDHERRTLRERVFTGPTEALDQIAIGRSLSKPELWLLEVNDRDTKGLGGPTTNLQKAKPGERTNYRDFVLNLGSPRDEHLGAGTYGFGKTASYGASECGSIVIWSRSREDHGLEHRLIASAMTPSFTYRERPFTGRHWWGIRGGHDAPILPLRHNEAADLGAELFQRKFGPDQTGTSLLIVDPHLDDVPPQQFARKLAEGALKNLWPKLHPDPQRTLMDVTILFEGQQIHLGTPSEHPVLQHFATALKLVRNIQNGSAAESALAHIADPFVGQPVGTGRTQLGQLVLVPFPTPETAVSPFEDEWPVNHVCYMRHRAELVVKYEQFAPHYLDGISWVGVFKPSAETDDAFADSEPPTHDDWSTKGVIDRTLKSIVNISLNRIKDELKSWLRPKSLGNETAEAHPAAVLANALSGLVPQADGQRVTPKDGRKSSTSRPRASRPSATIEQFILGPIADGLQEWAFKVDFTSPEHESEFLVQPRVAIATVDKPESDVEGLAVLGWDTPERLPDFEAYPEHRTEQAYFGDKTSLWLRTLAPAGFALQITFTIEEPNDGKE